MFAAGGISSQNELMSYHWDRRFLQLAKTVSSFSKDPSTQVGAVITRDKVGVSWGYNGFPSGMPDTPELYADRDEKYSRIIHAEVNALLHSPGSVQGCTLYTYPFLCCDRCVVMMLEAGIQRFVCPTLSEKHLRWADSLAKSKLYIWECNRQLEEIPFEEIL